MEHSCSNPLPSTTPAKSCCYSRLCMMRANTSASVRRTTAQSLYGNCSIEYLLLRMLLQCPLFLVPTAHPVKTKMYLSVTLAPVGTGPGCSTHSSRCGECFHASKPPPTPLEGRCCSADLSSRSSQLFRESKYEMGSCVLICERACNCFLAARQSWYHAIETPS